MKVNFKGNEKYKLINSNSMLNVKFIIKKYCPNFSHFITFIHLFATFFLFIQNHQNKKLILSIINSNNINQNNIFTENNERKVINNYSNININSSINDGSNTHYNSSQNNNSNIDYNYNSYKNNNSNIDIDSSLDKDMIGLKYPEINFNKIISKLDNNNNIIICLLKEFMKQLEIKLFYLEKEINITKLAAIYTSRKNYLDELDIFYDDENIEEVHQIVSWMVIHQSTQLMGIASDKYLVCKYAQLKLGENLCQQRVAAFDTFEEINFDKLLEYGDIVLKSSNGGYDKVFIFKDMSKKKIKEIKKQFKKSFNNDFGIKQAEYFHLYSKKRIVVEKIFMPLKDLYEFKLYIINHKIIMIYVKVKGEKADEYKFYYYDSDFKPIPEDTKRFDISIFDKEILNKLKDYALRLSEDFHNFIRVDLFLFHNKIYLSELTFDSHNGKPFKNHFKKIKEAGKNWKKIV